jgi:UDP-N-acetylglucosamine--N-acetylmuramyl-(pentapeptide) pyrophosphoryl-undecaprenol N-acetylglucosamine transferase
LVLGGSQGAVPLNERVPAAVAQVSRALPLRVIHQCGRGRDASVREAYARFGVEGVTVVPFVDDVASAIADADLVIARAGAVTLAEISAIGRAALLIPFPHATDDHQTKNAEAVTRHGAAVCLRETDANRDRLAIEIHRLLSDDPARVAMSTASRDLGRPNAAYDVAADLLALAGVGLRERTEAKLKHGADVAVVHGAVGRMP